MRTYLHNPRTHTHTHTHTHTLSLALSLSLSLSLASEPRILVYHIFTIDLNLVSEVVDPILTFALISMIGQQLHFPINFHVGERAPWPADSHQQSSWDRRWAWKLRVPWQPHSWATVTTTLIRCSLNFCSHRSLYRREKYGIDNSTGWSTVPASPGLLWFCNRGNTEGTGTSEVFCLMFVYACFVFIYICVGTGLTDFGECMAWWLVCWD